MGETKVDSRSIFRQALTVNKKPFPWLKAFLAGVAAGLPIAIGLFFGSLHNGLIAGLGGFTFLYVFPIPYAQLAKKLAWCVLAITGCVLIGTILAPYPIITSIMMGIIGAIGIFVFGALRLVGPSAIFFVLIFAMVTGMPIAPEEALSRAGLAFLGGALSWIIAMSGWLFYPHGPEKNIVKRSYLELANYFDAIGTTSENDAQHRVMATLKEANETIASGYIAWRNANLYNHLVVLNNYANKIYFFSIEQKLTEQKAILPVELGESLRKIAEIIDTTNMYDSAASVLLNHPYEMDEKIAQVFMEINAAKDSLMDSSITLKAQASIQKPSAKRILLGAFDKNSIIFINALRFGAFTIFAAIFAFEFEFNRSFWIPLSCVAVMSGATVVATFHRAIQRSFGTIFGILIASIIISFHPTGYIIALLIFLLTFITELFIVKNYGLAALFFTPAALIMAEAGSNGDLSFAFIASTRLIDVLIGVIIGLIGVWFVGRKSASSRLPHLVAKTIRSQEQVFYVLFSNQKIYQDYGRNIEFNKMETNIRNLKTVFDTATGEIPKDKKAIEHYWPIVNSLEELGFLFDKCARLNTRPILDDEIIAHYLLIFKSIAIAADRRNHVDQRSLPKIAGFPSIVDKIEDLQLKIHRPN
ncbi:FUSC family protein [Lysinibacillus sp. SGAir0095]|uniref:FUSC family protein n=1 Tax=Lysinibacillus sp. SGAir0095 TaxID=2070463 RepID=UPI00143D8A97|nr:FUSC family protein [Lysinibacillus sp. SGAir0095]